VQYSAGVWKLSGDTLPSTWQEPLSRPYNGSQTVCVVTSGFNCVASPFPPPPPPPHNYLSAKLSTNVDWRGKSPAGRGGGKGVEGPGGPAGGSPSSTHPGGPEVSAGAAAWSRGQSSPPAAEGSAPPARSSSPLQSQRRRPGKAGEMR